MIVVQSYFNNKFSQTKRFEKHIYAQAKLSVQLLKKHGYNVVLFTDDPLLEQITYYDEIKHINIQEHNMPQNFWSSGKLIACSLLNEPYIHIDIDLFLIENVIADYINHNFFCLHNEPYVTYFEKIIDSIPDFIVDRLLLDKQNLQCNNMSIFGGQSSLINSLINKVLDTAKNNYIDINQILLPLPQSNWKNAVFYEQVLLTNSYLIKPNPIYNFCHDFNNNKVYEQLRKIGVHHLWFKKQYIDKKIGLENYINHLEKKYL